MPRQPTLAARRARAAPYCEATSNDRTLRQCHQRDAQLLAGARTTTTNDSYDNMYRLVATTTQSTGPDTRVVRQRYDLRGNVIGTLNGIGSAALAALGGSPTQAQIDGICSDYGTTLTYDKADRLLSSTDPNNNKRFFYYDADGPRLPTRSIRSARSPAMPMTATVGRSRSGSMRSRSSRCRG